MSASVKSIIEGGTSGTVLDVECHVSNGLPSMIIVGFTNKAVDEAKERLRSAFSSSKLELPRKRITLNLAPADIPKDGTSFDLAMAIAVLSASGQIKADLQNTMILGELSLEGTVRPIRGIIGKILAAREHGVTTFIIPSANLSQAQLVPNVTLYPASNLHDVYLHLTNTIPLKPVTTTEKRHTSSTRTAYPVDFQDVVGQAQAKRALEIAAAGSHNVLLNGPPGTGKSMLAKALPSILPPLNPEEMLEVTHLHSLAAKQHDRIVYERPFRAPHHSSSSISIIGGGQYPKPGEITLSHRGVLFFDELPEYDRPTIEALRQPLEDKVITVARARDSITFPADFILVATSNPCPCGHYGSSKPCSCMPGQIVKYQRKLSGPILDRIDMHVDVEEIAHAKLLADQSQTETSASIRARVLRARKRQATRYGSTQLTNSLLNNKQIKRFAQLTPAAEAIFNQAAEKLQLSARAYMRTLKVARTIADLAESDSIDTPHITEALQYRSKLLQNQL